MTYTHKLVYHYLTGEEFTVKIASHCPLKVSAISDSLHMLVIINEAFFVDYHMPDGRITRAYGSESCNMNRKKPLRTTNPNSKTKTQKISEAISTAGLLAGKSIVEFIECSELKGKAFTNRLIAHIGKLHEQPNYHFWLGEDV